MQAAGGCQDGVIGGVIGAGVTTMMPGRLRYSMRRLKAAEEVLGLPEGGGDP
jgi:hypothetical protein